MASLDSCICGDKISTTESYCRKKTCLISLVEGTEYIFGSSSKKQIEDFIEMFPISVNKKLLNRDPIDINSLNSLTQEKILKNPSIPLELILPLIETEQEKFLTFLQQHNQIKSFGLIIRRKKFTADVIDRLKRLSSFFALFLYYSRSEKFWNGVMDTIIQSSFTPEILLIHLDVLYRQNELEYPQFYEKARKNKALNRLKYSIESSKEEQLQRQKTKFDSLLSNDFGSVNGEQIEEQEKISGYTLEKHSTHWFPEIRLAVAKHPLIFKNTLQQLYDFEVNWSNHNNLSFSKKFMDHIDKQNPKAQKISPVLEELIISVLKNPKVSSKLINGEIKNPNPKIRRVAVLSSSITLNQLKQMVNDEDPIVSEIANLTLLWKSVFRKLSKNTNKKEKSYFLPFPLQWENVIENISSTKFY